MADSQHLIKPLLADEDDSIPWYDDPPDIKVATPRTSPPSPSRYKRRSAMARAAARRKSQGMNADDRYNFNKLLNEEGAGGYTDFSSGHSVASTVTATKSKNWTVASVEEEDEDSVEALAAISVFKCFLVGVVSLASVGFYSFAIFDAWTEAASLASWISLGVAGGVSVAMSPWVFAREVSLARFSAKKLRNDINMVRNEASQLERQVQTLVVEVVELRNEAEIMAKEHEDFRRILDKQGVSAEEVVDLARDNKEILFQMQKHLREAMIQTVIREILRADRNRDDVLDSKELMRLSISLNLNLGAYGIVFDVDKFEKVVGLSSSIYRVVSIVKNLIYDEFSDQGEDTHLDESSITSSVSLSKSETEEDEEESKFEMFYMPVRRAFENYVSDTMYLFSNNDNLHGPKYMLVQAPHTKSPRRRSSNVGVLKNVIPCPKCVACPYCIAGPEGGIHIHKDSKEV